MGRFIGVMCCIIGIFLLSLIVVTLMLLTSLDEDEAKAYQDIDMFYTKGKQNNFYSIYFDTYIKYKMNKIRKPQYVENQIEKAFINKNKMKVLREKYFLMIRAKTFKPMKVSEFCSNVREIWEPNHWNIMQNIVKTVDGLTPEVDHFTDNTFQYLQDFKTSKNIIFRIVNLSRFISMCGNPIEISNLNEVKGDSITTSKHFRRHLKEFHVKFKKDFKSKRNTILDKSYYNESNFNPEEENEIENEYEEENDEVEENEDFIEDTNNNNNTVEHSEDDVFRNDD